MTSVEASLVAMCGTEPEDRETRRAAVQNSIRRLRAKEFKEKELLVYSGRFVPLQYLFCESNINEMG